jgi:YD repeat-containing protein
MELSTEHQQKRIYDSLNRLLGIAYPTVPGGVTPMPNVCATTGSTNNANVCFAYGTSSSNKNNGRVTTMTDSTASESYTYDAYGNVLQLGKTIGSTTYTTNYQYNYANQLSQITYPSGRAVAQNLDTLGRLSSVVGTLMRALTLQQIGALLVKATEESHGCASARFAQTGWKTGEEELMTKLGKILPITALKLSPTQFQAVQERLQAEGRMPSLVELLDVIAEVRAEYRVKILTARKGRGKSCIMNSWKRNHAADLAAVYAPSSPPRKRRRRSRRTPRTPITTAISRTVAGSVGACV